ncbi:MAG: hypothetical protein JO302_02975 [Candidatus Eremiobacteraeota bacterium]|nr:hypothetical protein [Candidatus Eremiobacteraeota bacterium]
MNLHLARLFPFLVGVLALGGCAGNGSGTPGQTNPLIPTAPNAAHETSWMARDADTQDLLYVSNAKDGSIYVYSYPQGKLAGSLFNLQASGLCSNANGDVFIPKGNEVLEYAHGGTQPLAVLRNPLGGVTQFCSVDPTTGNLAVSGGISPKYGVAIYTNGKGDPRIYMEGDRSVRYSSCAYDGKGNLFVVVTAGKSYRSSNLVELPNGGAQVRYVTWNGTPRPRLGSIQWDGKYLAAESPASDSHPAMLFRYRFSGRRATLVGKTALPGAGSPLEFWIYGAQVVVPNQGTNSHGAAVTLYDYSRGDKTGQINEDAREPQAATMSIHKIAVTTYHYNNQRTGWNNQESVLTPENVNSSSFGLLQTVTLNDQVDTQPLIVPNETTTTGVAPGKHDVVYVATESNSVYAIDASSGTVLFQQNLGSPVPNPLGCHNNGPNVGIDGTPVIDRSANAMYVIAYTMTGGVPTYFIHELHLSNLTDMVTPVLISASHTLSNGSTYTFNATYQRQRPGLLEANGKIYAGFGSFCDFSASRSRGWVLGWQAGSLAPLAANQLNDVLATSPDSFFLSSVWMSGYGIAADTSGNIYFATGNSDPTGTTYNSVTNLSESVVKISSDLATLLGFFTPSDVDALDVDDEDTGSGGVLVVPNNRGTPLAAAAGKAGTLFLLNRKNLGGYNASGPNNDLGEESIGGCWCGPSYFDAASDSIPRIVASGGNNVTVWQVTNPPSLVAAGESPAIPGHQDPGFFTTVSSNGSSPGAIIWAVARPQTVPGNVTLFAFASQPPSGSSTLETLYQANAGSWESAGGNANLVPVVANGKVYVASYEQLNIFGILPSNPAKREAPLIEAPPATMGAPHEVTGTLVAINGAQLALRTRTGKLVRVDDSSAVRHERSAVLVVGKPFTAGGTYNGGVFDATAIWRAKPSPETWPTDR